ncbi:MAG: hypothetical protein OXP71_09665 [Candidatus Poribacteria bacterium]|nr:hypothetical protein [Candidatus Poribacteria bacterium]
MNEIDLAGAVADGVITYTSWYSTSDNLLSKTLVGRYQSAFGFAPDP